MSGRSAKYPIFDCSSRVQFLAFGGGILLTAARLGLEFLNIQMCLLALTRLW